MITLTKLKLAGGDETPRFEATVCWHGKPVGIATNGGTGGACRVWWTPGPVADAKSWGAAMKRAIPVTPQDTILAVLREASRQAKRLFPDLYAHLDPEADPFARYDGEDALSTVLMHEVELAGHARSLDRTCKTHTVVRLYGAKPGQLWQVRGATPADLARERSKPDVAVVLNDLPSRERAERLLRAEPAGPVLSTHP